MWPEDEYVRALIAGWEPVRTNSNRPFVWSVSADSIGQSLRTGDRIVWTHGFCGQCVNCVIEHQPTLCTNRRGYMSAKCTEYPFLTGGFAEYCYVYPTSGRIRVPDEILDPVASAASCALRTVMQGFDRLGGLDDRHHVVIQGSGPRMLRGPG